MAHSVLFKQAAITNTINDNQPCASHHFSLASNLRVKLEKIRKSLQEEDHRKEPRCPSIQLSNTEMPLGQVFRRSALAQSRHSEPKIMQTKC